MNEEDIEKLNKHIKMLVGIRNFPGLWTHKYIKDTAADLIDNLIEIISRNKNEQTQTKESR